MKWAGCAEGASCQQGSCSRVPSSTVIDCARAWPLHRLGTPLCHHPSLPDCAALAACRCRVGRGNMCIVHVSLVPIIGVVGEQKTKPTQHSVAVLRSLGLHPDLLACRCSEPLDDSVRQKLVREAWQTRGWR